MKILILDHDEHFSGSTKSLLYILDKFKKNGYDITIVTSKSEDYFAEFNKFDINVIKFNSHYKLNISSLNKIDFLSIKGLYSIYISIFRFVRGIFASFKYINRVQPDLIYINEIVLFQFGIVSTLKNIPTIINVRTQFTKGSFGFTGLFIKNLVNKFCNAVIAISEIEKMQFNNIFFNVTDEKYFVVREFLSKKDFFIDQNIASIKEKYNIPLNKKIIIMIGGFHINKGTKEYLKALKVLQKRNSDHHFILVGAKNKVGKTHEEYYISCIRYIKEQNLTNSLSIIEEISDVNELLSASDILVSSNNISHFSRPVIEGWAKKKAVIATDLPHSRKLIENKIDGILYNSGEYLELVNAIKLLSSDEELYNKIAQNGYNKALTLFDSEKNTDEIINICENLMSQKST